MKKISALLLALVLSFQVAFAATFSDVNNDHPYYTAITVLSQNNIVSGYPDGSFKPENTVNRVEALKMILGSARIDTPENTTKVFKDLDSKAWYMKFVVAAKSLGIVAGNPDGTFAPARNVNKAEFLKMLLESFKVDLTKHQNLKDPIALDAVPGQWFLPYLSYAKTIGLITPTLQNKLNPEKNLTRGECAEIIYRMLVVVQGGDAQKLLNIAESNLVDLLIDLNNNDIQKAINHADTAVFYTDEAVKASPGSAVALGANRISQGFRSLCLAYQAGVDKDFGKVKSYVKEAKDFAKQAADYSASLANLKTKIDELGQVLLDQAK